MVWHLKSHGGGYQISVKVTIAGSQLLPDTSHITVEFTLRIGWVNARPCSCLQGAMMNVRKIIPLLVAGGADRCLLSCSWPDRHHRQQCRHRAPGGREPGHRPEQRHQQRRPAHRAAIRQHQARGTDRRAAGRSAHPLRPGASAHRPAIRQHHAPGALVAPPGELQTLFGQVADRIILQYANTSRQVTLAYPVALIGDTVPPQIRDVQTQNVAGGVKVTWTTDEFATSEVRYGTAPGVYTQTASDPLFEKTHALTLTGLTAGQTYYFVVRGADRSGNQAQSGEYQVKVQTKTYLPLIRRR